jgi:hypothetical protein
MQEVLFVRQRATNKPKFVERFQRAKESDLGNKRESVCVNELIGVSSGAGALRRDKRGVAELRVE